MVELPAVHFFREPKPDIEIGEVPGPDVEIKENKSGGQLRALGVFKGSRCVALSALILSSTCEIECRVLPSTVHGSAKSVLSYR